MTKGRKHPSCVGPKVGFVEFLHRAIQVDPVEFDAALSGSTNYVKRKQRVRKIKKQKKR